jgi:hypothetical protein
MGVRRSLWHGEKLLSSSVGAAILARARAGWRLAQIVLQEESREFTFQLFSNNLLTSLKCLKQGIARPRPGAVGRAHVLAP